MIALTNNARKISPYFNSGREVLSLLRSLVESVDERVRLVRKSKRVLEEEGPATNDLARRAATLAFEPLAACGVGDASEPERKHRRQVERGRRGVRETHNSFVT